MNSSSTLTTGAIPEPIALPHKPKITMKKIKSMDTLSHRLVIFATTAGLFTGCQSNKQCCEKPTASAVAPAVAAAPAKPAFAAIRIKTGVTAPIKDSSGNQWLPDQGFADGDTIERPEVKIEGTKDQNIYQAERYSMTKFAQALPNGKYIVKLHFAET